MKRTFFYALAANCISGSVAAQVELPLYDKIPNSKAVVNKEASSIEEGVLLLKDISVPTLTMYRPDSGQKTPAVVICPGGAYRVLAAGHEGEDVARVLAGWGIAAFVLKYRLPDDASMHDRSIAPLQDAQRAMQMIRENAAQWNVDTGRVGVMGFSAGGHLASTLSTHFAKAQIENHLTISLRPDFSILIYPVVSFADSLTHQVCRSTLLGEEITTEKIREFSNDMHVSKETPPAFLVHAIDDKSVKLGNSIAYKEALERNGIPVELHIYEKGGHGFGMNNPAASDQWTDRLKQWLIARKIIK
ncbi:alpha/beta hydrolase [Terrimonas sp. NA20]|uniref:Alpha/beta hydrolase n=1 Tax=Terrimonas ginsenosidimutans TaxID=2908004 RepID=A0ABS9KSY4_9BACT|nr:alpha/beta hydrolase [Terrimonas ginsenosidimutans]MCG2615443.1 alpha/beta hydrolase [Terrimonas ginsenosidimutans]